MGELKDYNFWLNALIGRVKNLSSYKEYLFNFIKTTVHYIAKTVSGTIVSFSDGVDKPMLSLKAQIEPVQDLNGYDSPWPAGGGSNRWDEEWEVGIYNATTGQPESSSGNIRGKNPISVAASTAYYASISGGGTIRILYYDSADTFISSEMKQNASFTTPSNAAFVRISTINYGLTYNNNIAINYPSTVTTYAPYSNECPISGHTGVNVTRCGVNIWDEQTKVGTFDNSTGAYNPDRTDITCTKTPIKVMPSTSYYLAFPSGVTGGNVYFYDSNMSFLSMTFNNANGVVTTPSGCEYVNISFGSIYGPTYGNNISFNYPSSETAYHAYSGETITQEFVDGQGNTLTVYGGESEIVGGKLRMNRAMFTLNTANLNSSDDYPGWYGVTGLRDVVGIGLNQQATLTKTNFTDAPVWVNTRNENATVFFIRSQLGMTANELKAAMPNTDLQVVVGYAEPITYTLTPQEVRTFLGQNNLWNDVGDTEVMYLSKEE